ncbi:Sporulation protein YunB [compost metagenome]
MTDLTKWGRRGWRFRLFGGGRMLLRSGRPFSRVKTVSWGSRRGTSPVRTAPKKWGGASSVTPKWMTKPAGSRQKWGSRPTAWASRPAGGGVGGSGGFWGSRPTRPRFRRRTIVILGIMMMLILSVQSFVYIERNLRPPLMHVAKIRVKQMATQAINKAITEQVASRSNSERLIDWKMNSDGKISGFMLNYAEHMNITSQTINTVQATLNEMTTIPEHIPIGHALDSAIISSYGPKVPVKFEPVGVAKVELSTRHKNAAINMILVEVYIKVITEVTVIIPFDTEPEVVETDIPISYVLVVGDVPMYYYDGSGRPVGESAANAPNISVPLGESSGSGVTTTPENHDKEKTAPSGEASIPSSSMKGDSHSGADSGSTGGEDGAANESGSVVHE